MNCGRNTFCTEDGGDTWEAQESGIEEDVMRVTFVNEKRGWAAGKNRTLIHFEDGGKTLVKQHKVNVPLTKVFFLNGKEGWITGATTIADFGGA